MKIMNFNKEFKNYNSNAITQKSVAEKLLTLIDQNKKYNSILELGCGTGIFTEYIVKNLNFNTLDLNDIFDTREFFSYINYSNFFIENMESLTLKKYSLILSSSAFQWVDNFEKLIEKISKSTDYLVFSIYSKGNLIEIFNHFGVTLEYHSTEEIKNILQKYFKEISFEEDTFVLEFPTPLAALKHLKKTGVTGFQKSSYSLTKSFNSTLLTYKISYFSCKK